ncbi:twin-arginine translocase subunit TatB [Kaustia mangrovi]|uniref:Sec-independent protein translocase protein TatB n=1 Tax=Kaustia mangrovi TaxID=2593653 RepID=A0A7S8C1L4_9HYPH|nr:Sec-independent protein translocase protein TatB [Kaustia mangrovi]QPC41681.1 twin-arginine translocase subunit TatB [Kaustia mangrovi]
MFDIGGTELLVIAIIAIIVVGPKDLPGMLRNFGRFVGKMRSMARDFQNQFEQAARESGLDEVRRGISDVKSYSPANQVKKAVGSIADEGDKLKRDIETSGEPSKASTDAAGKAKAGNGAATASDGSTATAKTEQTAKPARTAKASGTSKAKAAPKGKARTKGAAASAGKTGSKTKTAKTTGTGAAKAKPAAGKGKAAKPETDVAASSRS